MIVTARSTASRLIGPPGTPSSWSLFKRSPVGSFHKVSTKHLDRYLSGLEWRYNNRRTERIFTDAPHCIVRTDALPYKVTGGCREGDMGLRQFLGRLAGSGAPYGRCPQCSGALSPSSHFIDFDGDMVETPARACRHCGWTTRPLNPFLVKHARKDEE